MTITFSSFGNENDVQISNYEKEVEEMKHMTRQEYVASLRRYIYMCVSICDHYYHCEHKCLKHDCINNIIFVYVGVGRVVGSLVEHPFIEV